MQMPVRLGRNNEIVDYCSEVGSDNQLSETKNDMVKRFIIEGGVFDGNLPISQRSYTTFDSRFHRQM